MGTLLLAFVLGCIVTMAVVVGAKSRGNSSQQGMRKLLAKDTVEALDEETGEIVEIRTQQTDPNSVEGKLIHFKYLDAMQNGSSRTLLCWNCWTSHHILYIKGYCLMRNALRTFRADRMSEVTDAQTGAAIDLKYFLQRAELEARDAFGNYVEDGARHSIVPNHIQDKMTSAMERAVESATKQNRFGRPPSPETRIPFGHRHGFEEQGSVGAENTSRIGNRSI